VEFCAFPPIASKKYNARRLIASVLALALVCAPASAYARKASSNQRVHLPSRTSETRRGRPRKFVRPSRAVTVTLPDDVIAALQTVNPDLSHAVATIVQPHVASEPLPLAELVGDDAGTVIVVPPNRALRDRAGVELVPLPDGRALIAFDETLSTSHIELRLADAMADPDLTGEDRAVFVELADILRRARRLGEPSLQKRNIIVLRRTKVARTTPEVQINAT
jgi:hypothetical protein